MADATAGVWIKAPRPGSYLIGGQHRLATAVAWCETDSKVIEAAEQEPGFVVTRPVKEMTCHGPEEEPRRAREEHEAAPLHRQPSRFTTKFGVRQQGVENNRPNEPLGDEKRAPEQKIVGRRPKPPRTATKSQKKKR